MLITLLCHLNPQIKHRGKLPDDEHNLWTWPNTEKSRSTTTLYYNRPKDINNKDTIPVTLTSSHASAKHWLHKTSFGKQNLP
jgi:hypothetical protein